MKKLTDTTYSRKIAFNTILSKELQECDFTIDASYESMSRNQVMSTCISGNRTIHLKINISFKAEKAFSDCMNPMEMSIIFRAYFITNYIRCLESAKNAVPTSYFSGLVTLESTGDLLSGKKIVSSVPDIVGENKYLRPIDVNCAIKAMTRVLLTNKTHLPETAEKACQDYIEALIAYTGVPETEYIGSKHAVYTVLHDADLLKSLVREHPEVISEYRLFSNVGFSASDTLSLDELFSACDDSEDKFWSGMIVRMLAITHNDEIFKKHFKHLSFKNSYQDFCTNSIELYYEPYEQIPLLKNNRQAVQRLIKGAEQPTPVNTSLFVGTVHYIR